MSRHSPCSRADLLDLIAERGETFLEQASALVGFARTAGPIGAEQGEPGADDEATLGIVQPPELPHGSVAPSRAASAIDPHELAPTPFFQMQRRAPVAEPRRPSLDGDAGPVWTGPRNAAPVAALLSSWADQVPPFRRTLTVLAPGRRPNIKAAIKRISVGKVLDRIPRRPRRFWPERVQVVVDGSKRLTTVWLDPTVIVAGLRSLLPKGNVEHVDIVERLDDAVFQDRNDWDRYGSHELPSPGTPILVIGDLGLLSVGGATDQAMWLDLARRAERQGSACLCLFPGTLNRVTPQMARRWVILPWERATAIAPVLPVDDLLTLVSPVIRLEPGLLRAVRRLFPKMDAGLEADLWQSSALSSRNCDAASYGSDEITPWRRRLDGLAKTDPDTVRRVLRLIRAWHLDKGLQEDIWAEEVLCMSPVLQALLDDTEDVQRADEVWLRHWRMIETDDPGVIGGGATRGEVLERFDRMRTRTPQGCPNTRLSFAWSRMGVEADKRGLRGPTGPMQLSAYGPGAEHPFAVQLRQQGAWIRPHALGDDDDLGLGMGSPLAEIQTHNAHFERQEIAPNSHSEAIPDNDPAFWIHGTPPPWAHRWGVDGVGPWVTIEIARKEGPAVTQRMRWIPAGRFLMGSPSDEPGRYGDEGPQHEVRFTQGHWMFDTPVTQALWTAVMGDNPSQFKGADRPVECVSWDDAAAFLERINGLKPGLDLSLPTEELWEYAARAGTAGPNYVGGEEALVECVGFLAALIDVGAEVGSEGLGQLGRGGAG